MIGLIKTLVLGGVMFSPFVLAIFFDYHKRSNYIKGVYFILFMAGGLFFGKALWQMLGIFAIIAVPFLLAAFLVVGYRYRSIKTASK